MDAAAAEGLTKDASDEIAPPKAAGGKKRFGFEADQREAFWRLTKLCSPEGGRITLGLLALMTNSLTNLSFPWILGQAVDRAGDADYVQFIGGTAGVYLVGSVASWVRVYCLGTSTERISARLRKLLFGSYMDHEVSFHDGERAAKLAIILDKDVAAAAEALTDKLAFGVRSLNSSINGSILLVYQAPQLCGFTLAIVPVVGVGAMLLGKYAKKIRAQLRELEDKVASFALERLQRISTVRLNAQEETEKAHYEQYIDQCYDLSSRHYFAQGSYMSFTNLMTNVSLMGVLWYGGRLMSKGKMTAGALSRFTIQTAFVGLGWYGLASFYSDMVKALEAAKRVFDKIDSSDSITAEGEDAANDKLVDASSSSSSSSGTVIALADVSFAYTARCDTTVLNKVSVTIPARGLIAFAGRSGAGKSTLSAIMSGLYRADSGTLAVAGKAVTGMSSRAQRCYLQDHIAVVQQDTGLLSGTVAENIAYGRSRCGRAAGGDTAAAAGASASTDEDIIQAARSAQAHEFISAFPDGYDTLIGEGGKGLSGGQQARIAIGRALLKRPTCLLLDEATAALDAGSEGEIIALLRLLVQEQSMTVVVFTHSEALMRACDTVHLLENGAVAQSGSYDDLSKKGLLKNLD